MSSISSSRYKGCLVDCTLTAVQSDRLGFSHSPSLYDRQSRENRLLLNKISQENIWYGQRNL